MKNVVGVFLLSLLLVSCAHSNTSSENDSVEQRISQLLQARVQKNWSLLYDMADSGYRKDVAKDSFMSMNRGMTFMSYKVVNIDKENDEKVRAEIEWEFMMNGYIFGGQKEHQVWIREDNSWNLVMARTDKFGF